MIIATLRWVKVDEVNLTVIVTVFQDPTQNLRQVWQWAILR